MALHSGLDTAFGTGAGRWIKRPPRLDDFVKHLQGVAPGIGIAPLRSDSTVLFAAIDLDEPDFAAAREMQEYIPGKSFIERTRSGNCHVWVYFSAPVEAYVPMGVLKEATLAADKKHVEVFPKNHDFNKVRLGNYINLPFHGKSRPILSPSGEQPFSEFLDEAEATKNDPESWRKSAGYLNIINPAARESTTEFGAQKYLHICALHILSGEAGPITIGHRQNVYFALAKQLTNWEDCDSEEALDMLRSLNDAQSESDKVPDSELVRILGNAERGQFKSTGCDDPVVLPFTHPDCPIAHPRS